jgi:uncharacterized protein YybS (DUF2232 family)
MGVPVSAPPSTGLALVAGSMAGLLFLLPRFAASAPFLAFPLSLAGLFAATPILLVRLSGRLSHAFLALITASLVISVIDSPEIALSFVVLFGAWALVAGEVMSRRKSVIAGCAAGFAILAIEALAVVLVSGTAPMEETLQTPQVQKAFSDWSTQAAIEPAEAKAAIEQIRAGILTLYPALSVISAACIVVLNAVALGRLVGRSGATGYPRHELLLLRWPWALVIAFIGSGALLLAPSFHAVAWNGLAVTFFLFLLQGLSVLAFLASRLFSSDLMRAALLLASLLGPWALLLSLLGLFDQWFDFRGRYLSPGPKAAPPSENLQ